MLEIINKICLLKKYSMHICLLTPSGLKCGPGSLHSLLLWMWKPCLPSVSPTTLDTFKFKSPSGSVCWKSIFPLILPEKVFSCQWVVQPSSIYRLISFFLCLMIKTIKTLPSTPSIAENSQCAVSGSIVSIISFTSEVVAEMQLKHKASIRSITVIHIVKMFLVLTLN